MNVAGSIVGGMGSSPVPPSLKPVPVSDESVEQFKCPPMASCFYPVSIGVPCSDEQLEDQRKGASSFGPSSTAPKPFIYAQLSTCLSAHRPATRSADGRWMAFDKCQCRAWIPSDAEWEFLLPDRTRNLGNRTLYPIVTRIASPGSPMSVKSAAISRVKAILLSAGVLLAGAATYKFSDQSRPKRERYVAGAQGAIAAFVGIPVIYKFFNNEFRT